MFDGASLGLHEAKQQPLSSHPFANRSLGAAVARGGAGPLSDTPRASGQVRGGTDARGANPHLATIPA